MIAFTKCIFLIFLYYFSLFIFSCYFLFLLSLLFSSFLFHSHYSSSVLPFVASDLDCIRALFNEKEKELSLAVAKVEELTRQLEELRGRQNAPAGGGSAGSIGGGLTGATGNGHLVTPASAELEKLRRELMVSSCHRLRF